LGKVQASIAAQQGQQWCMTWLAQLRQLILQLCNEQHIQYAKDIVLRMTASVQRGWQEVQFQCYTQWNTIDFYHQIGTLYANKGMLNIQKCLTVSLYILLKLIFIEHKFVYILSSVKERSNVLLDRPSDWNCNGLLYWCTLETYFSTYTSYKNYCLPSLLWY